MVCFVLCCGFIVYSFLYQWFNIVVVKSFLYFVRSLKLRFSNKQFFWGQIIRWWWQDKKYKRKQHYKQQKNNINNVVLFITFFILCIIKVVLFVLLLFNVVEFSVVSFLKTYIVLLRECVISWLSRCILAKFERTKTCILAKFGG